MRISNKVKRNISFALITVGIVCIIARVFGVISNPVSGQAWFELCGIMLMTYLCFDNFRIYSRRVKNGIEFGRE